MMLFSKEALNTLLREAQQELSRVEDAVNAIYDKGYGLCSDEFVFLTRYCGDITKEIRDLEQNISRLDMFEEILKK